jgi:single-strand DNA-binding protein
VTAKAVGQTRGKVVSASFPLSPVVGGASDWTVRGGSSTERSSADEKGMNHEHSHFDHRLTRDPEIRYTREGQANTTFGVAVNRRWQNKQTQEWEEAVSFFDVVTWADLGESIALSLTKGCRAIVVGRLEQRSWETSEGEKRSRVEISAEDVGPALRFATAEVSKTERREPATVGTPDTDGEEPS